MTLYTSDPLPLSPDLYIFWASESAAPGEEIAVQGHFAATAKLCLSVGDDKQHIEVPILSLAVGFIKAQLPSLLPPGVYQVWVQDNGGRSQYRYINQAVGDCFDSPQVYPNANVAIKGRDLVLPGMTPAIRLVSQTNGISLPATYIPAGSNRFKLNFTAPSGLVTTTKYNVYISNGYGGSVGETMVNDELMAIAPATDVYELGLAWSANYKTSLTANVYNVKTDKRLPIKAAGNGTANDLPAIMAAINLAGKAGGGVVYLPAGTYKCEGSGFAGLDMATGVILQGEGRELTTISYGTGSTIAKFLYLDSAKKTIGLSDVSIQCQDLTGAFGAGLIRGENIFLKNVNWEIQKGDWLEIIDSKKVAILDCEFHQSTNALIHGPVSTSSCEYVAIKRTKLTFVMGGINTTESSKCFIEGNTLVRDISMPIINGSVIHLMICEFTQKALFANNRFLLANGPIPRKPDGSPRMNDGESIISEGGGGAVPDLDHGQVSNATATTLTDVTRSWKSTFTRKPVISIVKGRGLGQVRKITSRTVTTLTVDKAWDIVPDTTSSYAIFNFGLEQVVFLNNEIRDQQRGITIYHCAAHHVDIVDNKLINSGSIDISPIQQIRAGNIHQFTPIYNTEIVGNDVNGATDPYNGVSIGVHSVQHATPQSWGTICTNLRITKNILTGATPNKNVIQDEFFPTGYHAYVVFHYSGMNYQDEEVPVILGTIVADNTAKDCQKTLVLNTASYQTSVSRTTQLNSPVLIDNQVLAGTNHGGVGIATL